MASRFVSILFALLLLLASQPARAQGLAVVTGRVTDPTGRPQESALVRIEASNVGAVTAPDGTYRVAISAARIRSGTAVRLIASRVGSVTAERSITLVPDSSIVADFILVPHPVEIDVIPADLLRADSGLVGPMKMRLGQRKATLSP